MNELFKVLEEAGISLPENVMMVLEACKSLSVFNSTEELAEAAVGGEGSNELEINILCPDRKNLLKHI